MSLWNIYTVLSQLNVPFDSSFICVMNSDVTVVENKDLLQKRRAR